MVDPPETPHNDLFLDTFSDVEHAAAVLRTVLPAEIVELFDWDALRLESGKLVTVGDGSKYCDLLFSVPHAGDGLDALVFVLHEHQSKDEIRMCLRLLGYMVRIWESWLDRASKAGRRAALPLPPILPVVLAHDPRGWRSALRFHELFEADPGTRALLGRFIPDFEFIVDDLSQASDEDLAARSLPPTSAVTLWALRDGRSGTQVLNHSAFWAPTFELLAELPGGRAVVNRIMEYLGHAGGDQSVSLEALAQSLSEHGPKARQFVMDSVERLREEGRKEGLKKGLQKGRKEGRADGQREMLQKQLRLKFGELRPADVARVEPADEAALEQYLERILTADSVAAVLGG